MNTTNTELSCEKFEEWYKTAVLPTHEVSTPPKYTKEALEWTWHAATRATDHLLEMAEGALTMVNRIIDYGDGDVILKGSGVHQIVKQTLLTLQQHGYGKD